MMRALLLAVALAACSAPAQYAAVSGLSPFRTQMQADTVCLELLARGVDYGQRPTVIDRHGFHRDKRPGVFRASGANVICAFKWSDPREPLSDEANTCTCSILSRQHDATGHELLLPARDDVRFSACHELHKLDKSIPDI